MDTPSSESTGELDLNQAASAFANLLEPSTDDNSFPAVDTEIDVKPPEAEKPAVDKPETEAPDPAAEDGAVTIEVDGKPVTLTKAELADAYKNGLRQADYAKKTMEAAEQRKSAEAETAKTRQERQQYAQNLDQIAGQLQLVLGQQQQIDMKALLQSDPVEYLRQQHLLQERQAQLMQVNGQREQLARLQQAEQAQAQTSFLQQQQQELLAKLPAWKDPAKATAERDAIRTYLVKEGFSEKQVDNVSDHKSVVLARKAMLYDQMISKAGAAAKKVATLPAKVERPGVNEQPTTDKRSAAYQRLAKSGSVDDAAALFSTLL